MITSRLLQSKQIACSFTVFPVSESESSPAHCSHSKGNCSLLKLSSCEFANCDY